MAVGFDGGGCLEEAGEEGVADGVVVPAAGVDGEVGGGDDVAVFVVDGCGDGAEAVFELLVDECPALASDPHELAAELVGGVEGAGGDGGELDGGEVVVEPVVVLAGEEDAAEGGGEGGVAGADVDRDGEDALGGGVGDVDDVGAVEDGEGGGLAERVGHVPQMRQRDLGDPQARQIRTAELEDLGAEAELAAVDADVAEVDEGEQEAAGGGAGQAGGAGHVAERERRVVGVEGPDHGQPSLQRLHEIRLPIGQADSRLAHRAAPGLAASRWRSVASSSGVGGDVVTSVDATLRSHPVASCASSAVTPGCTRVSTSSWVAGSGSSTPRSVITAIGPPPRSPSRSAVARAGPVPERRDEIEALDEALARLSDDDDHLGARGGDLRGAARAWEADDRRAYDEPMTVVLMLAKRSICAAPRNPMSIRPGCSQ